jgi:glycine/D-amino acid oxidase-like deaminating enzyme
MPYDVAVIGAGVFGSWTARCLHREAKRVLLVDAWGPAHTRSSSGGESRIIRMGYGADAIYTRMAQRSLKLWKELFADIEQLRLAGDKIACPTASSALFHRTGVLWIGRQDDPYTCATRATLMEAGVPIENLSVGELSRRYPQMNLSDERRGNREMNFGDKKPRGDVFGILEPASGAIMARRAVAAVVEDAIRHGVEYAQESVSSLSRPSPSDRGKIASLQTASGEVIHAGQFVFACGPWLPKLFSELLGKRIHPTRQEVLFFAPPAGDCRFAPPQLPIWLDFTDLRGPYVFPDLESRGVKLAFDRHGPAFDPDSGDRTVSAESVAQARQFLTERFPALRGAPLTESRVCQYENTSNGDFLIDRHPDFENVWLVGGGSGHGFKHGPAVGEYVAARINGAPEEPRFSLASKGETQSRTVY